MKRYHLVGIGGIGMCGLSQMFLHEGIIVTGSDRSYDRGENIELFNKLQRLGIRIYPQDGTGVGKGVNKVIISRAIENDNPDLIMARRNNITISCRQDELKKIFRKNSGIAVSGTSGKSTVVGMIGCIFDVAGQDITIINGGMIKNYITEKNIGNVHIGRLPYLCVETDESEGDLRGYHPEIGVITNIGSDHMAYKKLKRIYMDFSKEVKDTLVVDEKTGLRKRKCITYSIDDDSNITARDIELYPSHSFFKVDGHKIKLNIPGLHNILNALAAMGVAYAWGISLRQIVKGLGKFKGIRRRFDVLHEVDGIRLVDDYAHNPDKIRATLQTARLGKGRIIAIYQPHGYKPTKMFLNELAQVFSGNLDEGDYLFIPEIYYAGGEIKKDVSSIDLVRKIKLTNPVRGYAYNGVNVQYIPNRIDIAKAVRKIARRGDTILVMGARDNTLHEWAKGLLC